MSKRLIALLVGVFVLLGVAVTVLLVRVGSDGPASTAGGEFTEFVAEDVGVAISYPASWERVDTPDPFVRLLATPDGDNSLLVRTLPLTTSVTSDNLAAVREFTRELIQPGEGRSVEVLTGPEQIEVAGLPGWYYLYRFQDPETDRLGAHSHYFLFKGDQMIVVVLQALPAQRFQDLHPVFDRIVESLRVL